MKIAKCFRCVQKARPQTAPMNFITTTFPFELLSIDFLMIECKGQKQNILVVMDHFTKFAIAIPTINQTARTVAEALWKNVFMSYGFPAKILTDQGRDFESNLIREICQMVGIQKIRTTPYHPAGNPVERWNRTLIGMLRSLETEDKVDWRKKLLSVVHAYNASVHSSTGYSPYYLFFGRHPRLPVDLAFGIGTKAAAPGQYVTKMKKQLAEAYRQASENMKMAANKNKRRYDRSAHAAELEPGDRVLIRRMGPRLNSKIADRWETDIYVVIRKADGIPVYTVQKESGSGPTRTMHRNLLLPIGMLEAKPDAHEEESEIETQRLKPQTKQKRIKPQPKKRGIVSDKSSD